MRILAIETSCDETAVGVVEQLPDNRVGVISHVFASSLLEHQQTGGIVPEVAARAQQSLMIPTLNQALEEACGGLDQTTTYAKEEIDAIAVTTGPGLIGSLLVGVETAKSLALTWDKPLIPVNHLTGHLYANWLVRKSDPDWLPPTLPALGLIVSGGHTMLVLLKDHGQLEVIGQTRDDAAGECFDKCARALSLPYPGGPQLSRLAKDWTGSPTESTNLLPHPRLTDGSLDFSFSGLKAAFVRLAQTDTDKQKLSFALETTIAEVIEKQVIEALKRYPLKQFMLCGGVAANTVLREKLRQACEARGVRFNLPDIIHCTDNAAMIGAAAIYNYQVVETVGVKADPRLSYGNS